MESMEEKMKGLVIYRCKLFLRDQPELCKMMCDDRQWKKKDKAGNGSSQSHEIARLLSTGSASGGRVAGTVKTANDMHKAARKLPVPVHIPTSLPPGTAPFNWNPSMDGVVSFAARSRGSTLPSPTTATAQQLAAAVQARTIHPMTAAMNQAFASRLPPSPTQQPLPSSVAYPTTLPQDNLMSSAAMAGMISQAQQGAAASMHHLPMMHQNGSSLAMESHMYSAMPPTATQHHPNMMLSTTTRTSQLHPQLQQGYMQPSEQQQQPQYHPTSSSTNHPAVFGHQEGNSNAEMALKLHLEQLAASTTQQQQNRNGFNNNNF